MEENFETVLDSLKVHFTPERLKEMRSNFEEMIRDAPEELAKRKQNAALVRQLKEKHFPLNAWPSSIQRLQD